MISIEYEEGRLAYYAGLLLGDNPYGPDWSGNGSYNDWRKGWEYAQTITRIYKEKGTP